MYIFTYIYISICMYVCIQMKLRMRFWASSRIELVDTNRGKDWTVYDASDDVIGTQASLRACACACTCSCACMRVRVCLYTCVCVYICMVCRRAHAHMWICISWDSFLARRNCMLATTHTCVTHTYVTCASFMCDMAYSYVWHDPHTDTRVHIMYSHINTASAAYATVNCACRGDDPHK